jgi:hypothetical protein
MSSMVKKLFSGGAKQKLAQSQTDAAAAAKAQQDAAVAASRQQQDQAVAATEASLGKARRTPRGRRQLIGEAGSTLG